MPPESPPRDLQTQTPTSPPPFPYSGPCAAHRNLAHVRAASNTRAEQWQARSRPPRARGASARCRPAARTPPCKMIKEHVIIIQRVLGLRFSAASARSSAASPRSSMSRNTCAPCKIFEGYVLSSKGPSSSLLYLLSSRWPTDPAGTRRKRQGPRRAREGRHPP